MSTTLVNIREQLAKELGGLKDTVPPPSGRQISVKGKIFTFPDSKTTQGPLLAVILDHRNFNKYYTSAYNPQKPVPPQCFALAKTNALKPHPKAKDPQSESCAECTWNKWHSAPQGNGNKACKNTVRLAIAPPDATADDEPYIIHVSPTGLKSWAALCNGLEARGVHPIQVVTEIAFDANHSYPTLLFKATKLLEEESLTTFWTLREKAQALLDAPPSTGDN